MSSPVSVMTGSLVGFVSGRRAAPHPSTHQHASIQLSRLPLANPRCIAHRAPAAAELVRSAVRGGVKIKRSWIVMVKSPTSEFKSSAGAVMIRVPAGSFTMGSPESEDGHRVWERQREITFGNDFYLGKTPLTQEQYEVVTGTNPTVHERIGDAPVDSVSWDEAAEFCQRLTRLDREAGALPHDWDYRLPTEAEWEYACRAGSPKPRHGEPQDVAWYQDNADGKPHAVG